MTQNPSGAEDDLLQPLRGSPGTDRGVGGPPVPRGPDRPVDARRQPDQMAPGAHLVVLRDVPARTRSRRLPARSIRRSPTSSTRTTRRSAARHPRAERGLSLAPGVVEVGRLPPLRRRGDAANLLESTDESAHPRPRRAGHPPRAAAPGTDPDGHQARACRATRSQPVYAARHGTTEVVADAGAARVVSSSTAASVEIGHDGTGVRLRQRVPAPPRPASTPFALADRPVTCGEWLAFMADGGYGRPELWLSDGWAMVQSRAAARPRSTGPRKTAPTGRCSPWPATGRSTRPSRSATSATTRPTPTPTGPATVCPPRPSGRPSPRDRRRPAGNFLDPARAAIRAVRGHRPPASSATSGSGRRAPTARTRASGPRPARSVSTTGSSW